jgi:acetylornithine deacetylase
MAEAFIDYASSTVRPSKLVFAATVDEEFSFSGACRLIEKQLPVEACIVGEPTKLSGIIAHKGVARWRVIISGISAHGATPQLGRSAIYDGARVALALEAYADELNKRVPHSLLGHGVINVGRVNGGQSVNVVPDACTFEIERRLLPGEDAREAIFDCEKWVRERVGGQVEIVFENPYVTGVPLETKIDSAIVQTVVQAQRDHLGELLETAGAHYCTDGGRFSEAGIETIVCGPGDIALAHTREEFIEIEQLELATGLYRKVISKWAEREQIGKQRMMVL